MTQSVISFDSIMKKMLLQLLFYMAEKCFSKNAHPSSVSTAPHLMAQIKNGLFLSSSNVIICSSLYLALVFAIHSHGDHLGHVTWTIYTNFRSTFLRMRHMKFGFDWPSGLNSEERMKSVDCDNDDDDGPRSMSILH